MSDARALALANSHRTWARRWLRANSSMFLPVSPKAVDRQLAKRKKFVKGAVTTVDGAEHG